VTYNDGSMSRANGPCPLTTISDGALTMAANNSTKTCNTCGQLLPLSGFFSDSSKPDGLRKSCKGCTSKSHRAYVARNLSEVSAYKSAWYADRAEENRARARENYRLNAEHAKRMVAEWGKLNPEKVRAAKTKWKRLNPESTRKDAESRRRQKSRSTPKWANKDAILAIYESAELYGLTVDHIVPIRSKLVCGLHCEANLRLVSFSENARKGNRHWPDMP
jgi:hypothetical protein